MTTEADYREVEQRIMNMQLSSDPAIRRLQKQARLGYAYGSGLTTTRAFLDQAEYLTRRRRARRNARLALALGFIVLVIIISLEAYNAH